MSHVLEFDSLALEFDLHRVLSSIHMKCETGQLIGLLGRNGSGKSSLMKMVFGSMRGEHKSIRVDKKPMISNYFDTGHIGYLPQENFLPPGLRVDQALQFYGISTEGITSSFPEFGDKLHVTARALSGGQRRLLEVLLILKSPHWFSLLDEPFTGLMPIHIEKLKELIVAEKLNKGIIITDHLYRHTMELADDLYLLTSGKSYRIQDREELVWRGYLHQ